MSIQLVKYFSLLDLLNKNLEKRFGTNVPEKIADKPDKE
jgi:hypothetical protein